MSSRNNIFNKIGYELIHVKEIDSTNTFLHNNYKTFLNKTILWTDVQTNGRGRFDRVWKSDDDLIFSILYKEKYDYTILIPLSIVLSLEALNINAKIKWPNDIYLNNKKLAGILIEDVYNIDFEASVVGIGLNYTDKTEFDGIGLNNFTNIKKEDLIILIIEYFERLKLMDQEFLIDTYKKYSLILKRKIKYHDDIFYACDINLDGSLVLNKDDKYIVVRSDEIDIKSSLI